MKIKFTEIKIEYLLFSLLICLVTPYAFSQDNTARSYLTQPDLENVDKLITRNKNSTRDDVNLSKRLVEIAKQSEKNNNWAAAYKGYAESAIINPGIENLTGMTLALVNIDRSHKKCIYKRTAKLRDISQSYKYLSTIIEYSHKSKKTFDFNSVYASFLKRQNKKLKKLKNCEY